MSDHSSLLSGYTSQKYSNERESQLKTRNTKSFLVSLENVSMIGLRKLNQFRFKINNPVVWLSYESQSDNCKETQ